MEGMTGALVRGLCGSVNSAFSVFALYQSGCIKTVMFCLAGIWALGLK